MKFLLEILYELRAQNNDLSQVIFRHMTEQIPLW